MILFPVDIINIILQYDGRIRYRKGKFIDSIHPKDERYNILESIIKKKHQIYRKGGIFSLRDESFYFEIPFNGIKQASLCYSAGGWSSAAFSKKNMIEICYYNFDINDFYQHKTYF